MLVVKSYEELGRMPEVGDKVKIVDRRTGDFWNSEGRMDKHLGTTLTVQMVRMESFYADYELVLTGGDDANDAQRWSWFPWMIEGIVIEAVEDIFEDPATWASGDELDFLLT